MLKFRSWQPRPVPLFGPLPDGGLPVMETEQSAESFATHDATGPGVDVNRLLNRATV